MSENPIPPRLEQADSVYGAGDFEGALRLYLETFDKLEAEPRPSSMRARVLAGIGNCYELLDQKGRAVSFWHRALGELRRGGQGESAAAALLENTLESYDRHPAAFISYARRDEAQAAQLEHLLHQRGCRLVRDVRDFRAGSVIQDEIARHLDKCPNYVVLWSRTYARRAFTRLELELVLRLTDPASPERVPGRRAIVLSLDGEPLPACARNLLMIPRAGRTVGELAEELHHALTGKRGLLQDDPAYRTHASFVRYRLIPLLL